MLRFTLKGFQVIEAGNPKKTLRNLSSSFLSKKITLKMKAKEKNEYM